VHLTLSGLDFLEAEAERHQSEEMKEKIADCREKLYMIEFYRLALSFRE